MRTCPSGGVYERPLFNRMSGRKGVFRVRFEARAQSHAGQAAGHSRNGAAMLYGAPPDLGGIGGPMQQMSEVSATPPGAPSAFGIAPADTSMLPSLTRHVPTPRMGGRSRTGARPPYCPVPAQRPCLATASARRTPRESAPVETAQAGCRFRPFHSFGRIPRYLPALPEIRMPQPGKPFAPLDAPRLKLV